MIPDKYFGEGGYYGMDEESVCSHQYKPNNKSLRIKTDLG